MLISYILDSASAASKFKLQSLQTRAARLITGSGPRTSRNPMYKSLGWLSLQHRQDFHKNVMVYKCCNSLAPPYLENLFTSNDTKYTYNTRHSSQLRSTKTRTTYYHRSFTVYALRKESRQTNVILQYKLLESILSAVCSVI